MTHFITRDLAADAGEVFIALTVGEPGDVAVGDPGRTFLERRVDQARSVVALSARVETVPDQVMDRPFDRRRMSTLPVSRR